MYAYKICDFTGMHNKIFYYLFDSDTRNELNHQVLLWRSTTLRASANLAFSLIIFKFCFSIHSRRCWFVPITDLFAFLYWFFLVLISFHLLIQFSNSSLNVLFSSSINAALDWQCLSSSFNSVILFWYVLSSTCWRVSSLLATWGELESSMFQPDDWGVKYCSGSTMQVFIHDWVT